MAVRRRRKCEECDKRFTTYESHPQQLPALVKADGRRENYNREKIIQGLTKACQKRPVSHDQIHALIDSLEKHLGDLNLKEIKSEFIGNFVMEELYKLDPVSYVRFASFYWNFDNIDDFVTNLKKNIILHKPLVDPSASKGLESESIRPQ